MRLSSAYGTLKVLYLVAFSTLSTSSICSSARVGVVWLSWNAYKSWTAVALPNSGEVSLCITVPEAPRISSGSFGCALRSGSSTGVGFGFRWRIGHSATVVNRWSILGVARPRGVGATTGTMFVLMLAF